jgi:hypothetical protein
MFNVEFASFLADFKGLNVALKDVYDKYEDDLNDYKKA